MKIRLIDFGVAKEHCPFRPHENDAGADVYIPFDCTLKPGDIIKIPLGFGLEIPDGQLVITPVIIADFVFEHGKQRGKNSFGSTGI